jgi:hypothetical protein
VPANPKAQVTGIKSRPPSAALGAPSLTDLERRSLAMRSTVLPTSTASPQFEPAGAAVVDQRGFVLDDMGPGAPSAKQAAAIATTEYRRAFATYLRKGVSALGHGDVKVLQEGVDEQGGFLVPAEVAARILSRSATPTRLAGM